VLPPERCAGEELPGTFDRQVAQARGLVDKARVETSAKKLRKLVKSIGNKIEKVDRSITKRENAKRGPGFGDGGRLALDFFGAADGANCVATQADGKLVIAGLATNGTSHGAGTRAPGALTTPCGAILALAQNGKTPCRQAPITSAGNPRRRP